MFHIQINASDFTDFVARVKTAGGSTRTLLARWGNAVAKEARQNARAKGGRSFWRQIAAATRMKVLSADAVEVANWHVAGAQKQFGGPILPKNAKALTIPLTEEAKRKRAGEFELGGRKLFVPKGTSVLGYSDGPGQFHALYLLRKRVDQKPEPWFPDSPRITALGLYETNRYAGELLKA